MAPFCSVCSCHLVRSRDPTGTHIISKAPHKQGQCTVQSVRSHDASLSQFPALPQDFLCLSDLPPHHLGSLLLPCHVKPPLPPRLISPPPSCHWGLFSELQNCQQKRASRTPGCDPVCSKRSLMGRVFAWSLCKWNRATEQRNSAVRGRGLWPLWSGSERVSRCDVPYLTSLSVSFC